MKVVLIAIYGFATGWRQTGPVAVFVFVVVKQGTISRVRQLFLKRLILAIKHYTKGIFSMTYFMFSSTLSTSTHNFYAHILLFIQLLFN